MSALPSQFPRGLERHCLGGDIDGQWRIKSTRCPACQRMIVKLLCYAKTGGVLQHETIVRPKSTSRAALAKEVPDQYASDYREAGNVLADSAKASAALSRRSQHLLRDVAGVKEGNLYDEIEEVINSKRFRPTWPRLFTTSASSATSLPTPKSRSTPVQS
jgi:hypothetical protein